MKARLVSLLLCGAFVGLFTGCTTNEPKPYDDNISNLPQNRPESWEGSAAFGSFFPQSY